MRKLVSVLSVVLAGGACVPQPSLQPLFTEDDGVRVDEMVGTWVAVDDSSSQETRLEISQGSGPRLDLMLTDDGRTARFSLMLGRLEGNLYCDLTAEPEKDEGFFYAMHRLPVHSFARVEVGPERLEVALLDPDWVKDALGSGRIDLPHATVERDVLLTATTPELQRFVIEHRFDSDAFASPMVFARLPEP